MTTKQYLSQVRKCDKRIDKELEELAYLKELANGISSVSTTDVKVKSSGEKDLLSKRVVKIVELEEKIDKMVDDYVEKRRVILEQIHDLDNETEKTVLHEFFFKGKTIDEIAGEIGYSTRSAYNIYSSALISFEQKYKKIYAKL